MPGKMKTAHGTARPQATIYLRAWRKLRGMRMEELAVAAGVSMATVAQIERGSVDFTGKTLLALATALNITPADLLTPVEEIHQDAEQSELWALFDELRRKDKLPEAAAILRALRDVWRT